MVFEVIAGIFGDKSTNIIFDSDFYSEIIIGDYLILEIILSDDEISDLAPISKNTVTFFNKELVEYYKTKNIEVVSPDRRDNIDKYLKSEHGNLISNTLFYQGIGARIMKNIFSEILNYLKNNPELAPLDLRVRDYKEGYDGNWDKYSSRFDLNNGLYHIYTDVFCYDEPILHKDELEVRISKDNNLWDRGEHAFWLKAEPIIEIGDKKFEIKMSNKFTEWEGYLEQLISLCDKAINLNKNVYWAYELI